MRRGVVLLLVTLAFGTPAAAQEAADGVGLWVGASVGGGGLRTEGRFSEGGAVGVVGGVEVAYWPLRWLGLSLQGSLLDLHVPAGSPYLAELLAGLSFGAKLGPLQLEPALLYGYASFAERCTDVPVLGTTCYAPSNEVLRFALGLNVPEGNHRFGLELTDSILMGHARNWITLQFTWSYRLWAP